AERVAGTCQRLQVFDGHGNAVQRTTQLVTQGTFLSFTCLLERQIDGNGQKRIEPWIQACDALQNNVGKLNWRKLFPPDQLGKPRGRRVAEVGVTHERAPSSPQARDDVL